MRHFVWEENFDVSCEVKQALFFDFLFDQMFQIGQCVD